MNNGTSNINNSNVNNSDSSIPNSPNTGSIANPTPLNNQVNNLGVNTQNISNPALSNQVSNPVNNQTNGANPTPLNNTVSNPARIPNNPTGQNNPAAVSNPSLQNIGAPNVTTASNTQNVSNSGGAPTGPVNNIKIEETSVTKSQKGTITVATINNGTVSILNNSFPEPIDISVKNAKIMNKNGKKVRIMTKRELITNIVLSFFFVLALCGVGYGTYYYIFKNNPRNFETKNITVELGEEIPASVRNYINLTDISEPDYNLDLSNVKNEIGTYTYKVSYGNTTKTGTITINDTTAPVITFKEVSEFDAGTNITKDMLVAACEDISDCTYELTSPIDTENPGEITASITAKDNLSNSKDYTINLTIIEKIIKLSCSGTNVTTDENGKTLLESNNYDLNFTTNKILKTGNIKVIRTYLSDSDYVSIKDGLKANGYTLEEVNRRAIKESTIDNVANLTTQDEIKTHLESSGYTCSINE